MAHHSGVRLACVKQAFKKGGMFYEMIKGVVSCSLCEDEKMHNIE